MNIRTILWSSVLLIASGCRPSQPQAAAVAAPAPAPVAAPAPVCTSTDGATVVNGLLSSLTPVLDKAWPSVAVSTGLDPYKNVMVKQKIPLKCSYGGDEICGAQASGCKEEYAEVTVSTITGLAYMQFKDLAVTSLQARSGNQACPYTGSASKGTYACSYNGPGSGSAFLLNGESIAADISEIKLKVKCEIPYVKTWTETVYSGSAKCTGSDPEGTGSFNLCAGSCSSGSVANLSYTALSKLNLKLSSLSCKVSPSYSPVSWIADGLVPVLKKDLLNLLEPVLMSALNKFVAGYMPFPSSCGG